MATLRSGDDDRTGQVGGGPPGGVTPLPMGVGRALVEGARAVTLTAIVAACLLLGLLMTAGIVNDEVVGVVPLDLLLRGLGGASLVLAVGGVLLECCRRTLARALLLPAARAAPVGATPPAMEREALRCGPFRMLRGVGVVVLSVSALMLPLGISLLFDYRFEVHEAVIALLGAVGIVAGIVVIRWSSPQGPTAARWYAAVLEQTDRWGRVLSPVPRYDARRVGPVMLGGIAALVVGFVALVIGTFMRKPGRFAPERRWDVTGEAVIDVAVVVSAAAFSVGVLLLLGSYVRHVLGRTLRDGATVDALERGERVPMGRVDAVLVDRSAMEHASMIVGITGWVAVSLGSTPVILASMDTDARMASLSGLSMLLLPGVVAVLLAWELGRAAAVRVRRRRARVYAVVRHDPQPMGARTRTGPADVTIARDVAAPDGKA